jgi:two-component system, OmpR family, sensor histidine kinase KdpD
MKTTRQPGCLVTKKNAHTLNMRFMLLSNNRFRFLWDLLLGFGLALLATALTTIALLFLRDDLNTSTVALLYLTPVLVSTSLRGLWPGVFSAFAAFLTYNYFFLQPYYTFIVHQTQDIVALIIFLVVAVFISQLVGRARSGLASAVARASETARLYELSLDLAGASSVQEIAEVLARKTGETVQANHLEVSILPIQGETSFRLSVPKEEALDDNASVVIPLETVRAHLGELLLWLDGKTLAPDEERLLRAFAVQVALALERTALANTETRARILEESDRLKSALLSSVSHEFRTPLATIKAATTSLLSDDIPWEAPARIDLLSVMDEETDYLNYLVGNLLDMSRIESGALQPKRQWNDLAEIVDGVAKRLHRQMSHFNLDIHIPDDLPLVPVDYSQMEQVFTNLLNNSAKYALEGSTIQIEAVLQDENTALIKLMNEGPQVLPDHLERIFDKFFRVTEPEKVSGIGLGLSICKAIVQAHGGKIWAENVPGGLAFFFTLPLTLDGKPPTKIEIDYL